MHAEPKFRPQDYALLFQKGKEAGFDWFFKLLYPSLTLFATKITGDREHSKEIVSTAFIKIWKHREQFYSPEGIKAYLYQIVRNDSLKALKKPKTVALNYELGKLQIADPQKNQFQALVAAETSRQLIAALDLLPPQCSRIFRMIYVEGKTVRETAEVMNISVSTVRTQQKRGLDIIRRKTASLFLSFTAALATCIQVHLLG